MVGLENSLKPEKYDFIRTNLNEGYFVFFEDTQILAFHDAFQKVHDISRVSLLTNEFDINNGHKNIPKPYLLAEDGNIKEYGAKVLYSFINGEEADIAVLGALNKLSNSHLDDDLGADMNDYDNLQQKYISRNNGKRTFIAKEDAEGNLFVYLRGKDEKGNFSLKVSGKDSQKSGRIKIEANGAISFNQVDDKNEIVSQIILDNTQGKEAVIIGGPKVQIASKKESLKNILLDFLTAIDNMNHKTAQGPTVPGPINQAEFEKVKTSIKNLMEA